MPRLTSIFCLLALSACASSVQAAEFAVVEVPSVADAAGARPLVIAFSELRDNDASSPAGLVSFEAWAQSQPVEKQFLSPYPAYVEPTASITVDGVTRLAQEKLRMYVAEARFQVARSPASIDLSRYTNVHFLERLDPAIEHSPLTAAEADNASNKHPDRKWCEGPGNATCVQSKYRLEGKLPMAVQLVNQLTEDHKLFEHLEFQSELRIVEHSELDQDGLKQLTGLDAPVTGAIEQTIFHVNQLMQFGKFLAVFQEDPADPDQTTVTAFIALALKSRLLEKAKKYENVPVLRNLVPAMVLTGQSSFNAGSSISAGLPIFARNNLKAVASILDGARPACPSCVPPAACGSPSHAIELDAANQSSMPASVGPGEQRLEPDLLQLCRRSIDPFALADSCACQGSILKQEVGSCREAEPRTHGVVARATGEACEAGSSLGRVATSARHAINDCCP
jgi:hypothetical protein